jgi:hypothetical protein
MALDTVADYVADARTLLQDIISPYRYSDAEMIVAFNTALADMRRLRADLFLNDSTFTYLTDLPYASAVNTDVVPLEAQFRPSLVLGICAHVQLRDQEEGTDNRSSMLLNLFRQKLLGL